MSLDPVKPYRADHRLMKKLLSQIEEGTDPRPEELSQASEVFSKAGGSWERVFKGSIHDIVLLKKCLKIAVKKGRITQKPKWARSVRQK